MGGRMKVLFEDSGFPLLDYELLLEEIDYKNLLKPSVMPFTELPSEEYLLKIMKVAERLQERFVSLVVVGMGGSSRGAKALHQAVGKENSRLLFLDNIDPDLLSETLRVIDWDKTAFAFISKSGKTLETVSLMNVIFEELEKRELPVAERVVFVGDRGNPFNKLADELGAPFLEIPKEIGGRFSVFTAVGLLPAYFAGYDVTRFLEGAYDLLETPLPAFYLAASKNLHYKSGRDISVVMPYSTYMNEFTEWYAQLWAESLGKEGQGQTPLKAIGTSSQHSILQLFVDGPDDKFYQLFFVNNRSSDVRLPKNSLILPYVGGRTLGEIMRAEFEGTLYALRQKNRPVVRFELSQLSEYQMGYLFMTYMVAVVVMAKLIGINPYGQPAVEIGKRYARELLEEGRDGGLSQ